MKYHEQKGDLFKLDNKYALAHCISLDCAMGAGIAVTFDQKFKGMKKELLKVIKENEHTYPIALNYVAGPEMRNVFNLITKKFYYNKPTYETITECIKQMKFYCELYNVKYLAMPKIGCGLDRLEWDKVREIIQKEFKDTDVEIEVRYL